jgi:iron complex outermembrane receptor protein
MNKKSKMNKKSLVGCGLLLTLTVVRAAAAAPASGDEESEIATIVVTAQSRTQSELDVPIALQVLSAQQIQDLGAKNLADVNGYVPGLHVDGSQATQPMFFLRGIGSGDFGISTDSPVGVYVNGIYTGKSGGSLMDFNDVQRVEVLKGPQGTLFGRNSAAGAISIITNEPTQETDAEALVRYGRFNTVVLHGLFNAPLSDTTAIRLSVVSNRSDGWVTNETTGRKMGGDGEWGTRLAFKWAPAENTKLVLTWEHESLDQPATPAFGLVRVPSGTTPTIPATGTEFIDPLTAPLENAAPSRETRTFNGFTARLETQLDGLQFSSNTAYRRFTSYNEEDNTGTASALTYLGTINAESNSSFQQEFKLASKNDLLDWVAGASYYHVRADQTSTVNTTTDSIDTLFTNNPGPPLFGLPLFGLLDQALGASGLGFGNPWSERMVNTSATTSYAVYGDVIWHVTPTTNLTTGVRETIDRKSVSWYVPGYSAGALDAQFIAATGAPFGATAGAVLGALTGQPVPPLTNIIFSSAAATAGTPVSAEHRWTNTSPRLVLDQKIGADTMAFASVSRGYNAGGYNVFSPLARFDAEYMTNFELGFKSALPELHASWEGSLFRYKFTNLQNITLVNAGVVPVYDVTTSDQSAYGADLSGNIEVVHHLTLFGATEYLRQRYDQYSYVDPLTNLSVNLDGQPVGTPLLTITGGARIAWSSFGGKAGFEIQASHTTATRCNAQITEEYGCLNTPAVQTGTAQTRVDLRLGWQTQDQRYGAAILVNNAFNKQYVVVPSNLGGGQGAFTLGTPYANVTVPRFIGVELSARL